MSRCKRRRETSVAASAAKKRRRVAVPVEEEVLIRRCYELPGDLVLSVILPWLSAKSLCTFKSVCREWNSYISSDDFARRQSLCSTAAAASSALLYRTGGAGLAVLATSNSLTGIPDPNVGLSSDCKFEILACTNGLALLTVQRSRNPDYFLYICNPARAEGRRILAGDGRVPVLSCDIASIGLVFEPSSSPPRFELVHLLRKNVSEVVHYEFDVFSSDTGIWERSPAKLVTGCNFIHTKVVYAGKQLFWDCTEQLVFYNTACQRAGIVKMPPAMSSERHDEHEIGVHDEKVTLTRALGKAMEVWRLVVVHGGRRSEWVLMQKISLDQVSISGRKLTEKNIFRPLPYEGGCKLYVRVRSNRKKGREDMVEYDIAGRKFSKFEAADLERLRMREKFFKYHNSLVQVPAIATFVQDI